jgi:hypothetical protein
MTRNTWYNSVENDVLTHARRLPVQMDFGISADLPLPGAVSRLRLARQIRQDMWRLLRGLRGFSPVVQVSVSGGLARVNAGGAIDGVLPARARDQLAALLSNPRKRARWLRHARKADL